MITGQPTQTPRQRAQQPPRPPQNSYEAFAWDHNPDPQEWTPAETAEYLLFALAWTPGAVA